MKRYGGVYNVEIEDNMIFIQGESIGGDTNEIGIPIDTIVKLKADNKIMLEAIEDTIFTLQTDDGYGLQDLEDRLKDTITKLKDKGE